MRIAVIGDIHANIDALTVMLQELDRIGVDRTLCTGDIVGYGGAPGECIDALRERNIPSVRGNHDAYVTDVHSDWRIQAHARAAIVWTQEQLNDEQREWLGGLPRVLRVEGFEVVHSSHVWWPQWAYVVNQRRAIANFLFQSVAVSFNGHSHVPLVVRHHDGDRPDLEIMHETAALAPDERYLIAVGSVGQPRDRDPRACGVVYDTEQRRVDVVRVAYDIKAAQRRITDAGLPKELARRLAKGT